MAVISRLAKRILFLLLLVLVMQRSSMDLTDPAGRVRAYTRNIEFDFLVWELEAVWIKLAYTALGAADYMPPETQHDVMLAYLSTVGQVFRKEYELDRYYANPEIADPEAASATTRHELEELYDQRDQLAPLAESILQNQINTVVAEMGLSWGGQAFPPVQYRITALPLALIVSPRTVIRQDADISLLPDIPLLEQIALEEQVDRSMGVSSLVEKIGGVGMYPTMVMQTNSLNWLAEVVSHEWVHNYLTIRPLGASYYNSPELRIMNETTASIAGRELGTALIARYYPEFAPPPAEPASQPTQPDSTPSEPPPFNFRAEMHETRVAVDQMLAEGKIAEAEAYMETRRQFMWENGYQIRKLNQAYFAFHGAYADAPAGGPAGAAGNDIVGAAVRDLRAQSGDLAAFVNSIAWMWRFDQLQAAVIP